MNMEIDLNDYEKVEIAPSRDEVFAKTAELLGLGLAADLPAKSVEDAVIDYIERNHTWYRYDIEYQYMGYDCGDCYTGGDIKKGIICGDFLVIYLWRPGNKTIRVMKKKTT